MDLYNSLVTYGAFTQLKFSINGKQLVDWTEKNYEYVRYNPRKDIDRYGLSITSLDGGVSGIPDLDSLHEYNTENNTTYEEQDFSVPTDVYNKNYDLQKFLEPWKEDMFRTHIIKLNPGGYFPKHRDFRGTRFDSFRLISPLFNPCTFILEDKILRWQTGAMYFLDTAKVHELFNTSDRPSYWLVVNVKLNDRSFLNTAHNFLQL